MIGRPSFAGSSETAADETKRRLAARKDREVCKYQVWGSLVSLFSHKSTSVVGVSFVLFVANLFFVPFCGHLRKNKLGDEQIDRNNRKLLRRY